MTSGDQAVFELKNVSQRFDGVQALAGVCLRVQPGERVALVGPSGAGKTTLMNILNGSLVPSEGEVRVLGRDLARLTRHELRKVQAQIGTIYQQFRLVDNLRVIHNVNAGQLSRWPFWKAALSLVRPLEVETAAWALAQVGIVEKLYARTDQLSGGQQQRVALARVLVQNPAVILADEPVSNVDPARSQEIMDLLSHLSQQLGKTLIVSLHTIELAYSHCQRIVGLRQGRVLFDAPPAAVTPEMVRALYRIDKPKGGNERHNPLV